jgi:hypothetical protein
MLMEASRDWRPLQTLHAYRGLMFAPTSGGWTREDITCACHGMAHITGSR